MMNFLKKYRIPLHSEEEYTVAADYLAVKRLLQNQENFTVILSFRNWLKAELEETKKLWVNFHRAYFYGWQMMMEKVPELKSWEYKHELFKFREGFKMVCPFDEDSSYFVKYVDDIPIDIEELPENWAPPCGMDFCTVSNPERELTEPEYLAWCIFNLAKSRLEELNAIIEFAENPKNFCYKQIGKYLESNDQVSIKLWSFAFAFEIRPFEIKKEFTFRDSIEYIRYFQMK